jgi:hypothetical protein
VLVAETAEFVTVERGVDVRLDRDGKSQASELRFKGDFWRLLAPTQSAHPAITTSSCFTWVSQHRGGDKTTVDRRMWSQRGFFGTLIVRSVEGEDLLG